MRLTDSFAGSRRRKSCRKAPPRTSSASTANWPVYLRHDPDHVGSHYDLKPENILFDGDRVWLVDWEAAFLNDRYTDLAVAANLFVIDESDTAAYLHTYFGQPADECRLSRFFLMQQSVHMFYAI
jgi:thiamine kinase-like enzyme